jgi:hypothetical protein
MARGPARASDDVQMTFRLSKGLYDELKAAGNVSEAARERLEAASNDEQTRQFQRAIANVADTIEAFMDGPWHKNPYAWLVMRAAVETLMTARKPEGDPVTPVRYLFGKGDPETVGQSMALTELR